jgi:hypothetical protein
VKQILIYDIEVFPNFFSATLLIRKKNEYRQYIVYKDNQLSDLIDFLFSDNWMMVGYNNISYDYTIIHHILNHKDDYINYSSKKATCELYSKSQEIIDSEFSSVYESNRKISQLDLYLIHHYNNPARRSSLKSLEIAMNLNKVADLPFSFDHLVTDDEVATILEYNKHDVYATSKLFDITIGNTDNPIYKNKNKIKLRQDLQNKFNVSCLNLPDVQIGEQLMLNLYCRTVKKSTKEIKQLGGTPRYNIDLRECIPKWNNIKSKEFKEFINALTIINPEDKFQKSVIFHGIRFDFGAGGAHGQCKPGIYKATDNIAIVDFDIASLYPSLAKSLKLYPEHLGPEFTELYSRFIDDRIAEKSKPKDDRDNTLIEGYKLILNGTYGKTNEKTSFLYDPLYTYKTTIAGQIFIAMWAERLVEYVPELKFLSINTDGITIMLPRDKIDLARIANKELYNETGLLTEEAMYKLVATRDVNNYLACYENSNNVKYKGIFEIDKELHKDNSMRIVPIALSNYIIHNIPIKQTIYNHKNIYDFCLRHKTNAGFNLEYHCLEDDRLKIHYLGKNNRYYISNTGGALYKTKKDYRNAVNKGFCITLLNDYIECDDYDINYGFYTKEANKIINIIDDKQLLINFE